MMKKITFLLFGSLALLLGACQSTTESKVEVDTAVEISSKVSIKVVPIAEVEVDRSVVYTANLVAFEENYLAPASPGRIKEIYVEVGDRVKKGQLLVLMDQTQLHQARVQFQSLELDYARYDTLNKTGSIAKQLYDQFMANYDIAQSNVNFLEENTRLIAPFDGTITAKYFEDGELYSGAPNSAAGKAAVVTLMQIDRLKAFIDVSEKYYPEIKNNQQVELVCSIYPEQVFSGRVYRIHPTIDPTSRTFVTEVEIPNSSERLRPGMFGKLEVKLFKDRALLIPSIALLKLKGSNNRFVFIEKNGIAKRVDVTVGKRFDDQIEVISEHINIGDKLVVIGQSKLIDGSEVTILQ